VTPAQRGEKRRNRGARKKKREGGKKWGRREEGREERVDRRGMGIVMAGARRRRRP
jgi:hypothetical protein